MNQPSNPGKSFVFFPTDDLENFVYSRSNEDQMPWSVADIDNELSPIDIRFSNTNSPILGKRTTPDKKQSSPSHLVSSRKEELRSQFKLNPKVQKRGGTTERRFEPTNCSPLDRLQDINVPSSARRAQDCSQVFDNDSELNSSCCNSLWDFEESTEIPSNGITGITNLQSLELTKYLLEKSNFNDIEVNEPINITKIIKLAPLYKLFYAYFNNVDCKPFVEALDKDYEIRIVEILASYLRVTFKKEGAITLRDKMLSIFKNQPTRYKKKARMVQMIFTYTIKWMLFRYQVAHSEKEKFQIETDFFEDYFGMLCKDSVSLAKEFSIQELCKKHKNNLTSIKRCFQSKKFADDFFCFLKDNFLGHYQALRTKKLDKVFLRWEKLFLDYPSGNEAIYKVQQEVNAKGFKLCYTDQEIQKYFKVFFDFLTPKP